MRHLIYVTMDKQEINSDSSPTTQSDGDAGTRNTEEVNVTDQYSSKSQNKTSFKDFIVCAPKLFLMVAQN